METALAFCKAALLLFVLLVAALSGARAQGAVASGTAQGTSDDVEPLVVEGLKGGDVFGLGRTVVVRGTVTHGVIAFGGDVIVEGVVEGDVATIGGSVFQREGSRVGGDVIVLGGAYHHGKGAPGRDPASTTVMYAGYEQELRRIMRDPSSLFAPHWSLAYMGQRTLALLFWFIVSLALTAAMPGAMGRAVARLQLTSMRVAVIGLLSAIVIGFGVPLCLTILPTPVAALVGVTTILLLVLAALCGRVAVHAATGRWLERRFLPEGKRSETLALLMGAAFWTIILSLPYVWPLVAAGLLVVSLGLSLTARHRTQWKRA